MEKAAVLIQSVHRGRKVRDERSMLEAELQALPKSKAARDKESSEETGSDDVTLLKC